MSQFVAFALPGVPLGCVFALMGAGLVLTYRASGVFNLAFGAQAYASALIFYVSTNNGWPKWAAAILAIVVVSPALGLLLDRVIFRYTRTASQFVKLVPALGLLIVLPSAVQMIFGDHTRLSPPSLLLDPSRVYLRIAGFAVNGTELSTSVITVLAIAFLWGILKFTRLGLEMRSVVESPRLAQLHGVRSDLVGADAWILSSLFAGLAGVLLAPLYAQLSSLNFTDLLIAAIACGALGSFVSLPLTLIGGVAMGIFQELISGYMPSGSLISSGIPSAFPFIILLALLIAMPRFRIRREVSDPMAGCEPPQPCMEPSRRPTLVFVGSRIVAAALALAFGVSVLTWIPSNWVFTLCLGVAYSIIFLSIVLLTGMSGQVSLAQATFAGIGAFTAGQLAIHFGVSVIVGTVAGGLIAAAAGILLAFPTLRLGGIALALSTLGFSLVVSDVIFPLSWAGNGGSGITIPRPQLGAISLEGNRAYMILALIILIVIAVAVALIRSGTIGRQLAAIRGSEVGSESIGIDTRRLRLLTMALAAGIAGIGGAIYGSLEGSVSSNDFNYEISLIFVVVVATVGVRTISGAIEAGLAYAVLGQLISTLPSRYASLLAFLFGLAALTYVRHPEGVVGYVKRLALDVSESMTSRIRRGTA
jgi:branched-subunit amino acid ABC-type transport system permease component